MSVYITHMLFMDNVLILWEGSYSEWNHYDSIISLFCDASSLAVNVQKSNFVYSCNDMEIRNQIASLLPYKMTGLEGGFKYIGFFFKPNGYKNGDWEWLINKIKRKINSWPFWWLPLGGRLLLVNYVLQSIPFFWFSLFIIQESMVYEITKQIF